MADYKDGSRRKDWQQYSALMAASVLKSVVEAMWGRLEVDEIKWSLLPATTVEPAGENERPK